MRIKTFNDFSINEELFGLRGKLERGMKLWEQMKNDPQVEMKLEEGVKELSESEKEALRKPGLLKRVLDFFNSKSDELVSEGSVSKFESALRKVGSFFKEFGVGIATIVLALTGVGTVIAGALESQPMLVVIGVIVAAIGSFINKLSSDEY